MDPNFKAISEISSLEGSLEATDLLIMSRCSDTQNGYITRNVTVGKLSDILIDDVSAAALSAVWEELKKRYGNLVSCDLSDLENESGARAKLTSYALIDQRATLSLAVERNHAVSAIAWDKNHAIRSLSSIDVEALARDVTNRILAGLNLDQQLGIVGTTQGVKLADLTGRSLVGSIYSGDPSKLLDVKAKTTIGDDIAEVEYGGTNQKVVLKNGVDKSACSTTGETIARIGSVDLKNAVQILPDVQTGSVLATIKNGEKTYQIRDGFSAQQLDTTGKAIARITSPAGSTTIYNGSVMTGAKTTGKPVFTYNGTTYYNNVDVADHAKGKGVAIATVNGQKLYNGLVFEDDALANTTTVVFPDGSKHLLRGGIKVGTINPVANIGAEVAKVLTDGGLELTLRNGVDEDALAKKISDLFDSKLNDLRNELKADINGLKTYCDGAFLDMRVSYAQTVNGPVTFRSHITGSCDRASSASYATEAYSATRAKWA